MRVCNNEGSFDEDIAEEIDYMCNSLAISMTHNKCAWLPYCDLVYIYCYYAHTYLF